MNVVAENITANGHKKAKIIVVGNEKGGSGKTTMTIHLAVGLMHLGSRVACIDLDIQQASLRHFFKNRQKTSNQTESELSMPTIPDQPAQDAAIPEQSLSFESMMNPLLYDHDFVVVDTPAGGNSLSATAHSYADILVTPMNDSFVDLNLLGIIDPNDLTMIEPSTYSTMVWEQRKIRAMRKQLPTHWLVLRNRLSHLQNKNKMDVGVALDQLAKRLGLKIIQGFSERVIYKELFLRGLTVLDAGSKAWKSCYRKSEITLSHVAAGQEIRTMLNAVLQSSNTTQNQRSQTAA